jgi:hypothetical protein
MGHEGGLDDRSGRVEARTLLPHSDHNYIPGNGDLPALGRTRPVATVESIFEKNRTASFAGLGKMGKD